MHCHTGCGAGGRKWEERERKDLVKRFVGARDMHMEVVDWLA